MDNWEFRGQTATANTVLNQQEYSFPTDILKPFRIEIKYTSSDRDWVVLDPTDERRIEFKAIGTATSSSFPLYAKQTPKVWFLDQSFFIDPQPDVAVTGGLRIWYTQEVAELSATTDEPIFIEGIHPWFCYFAAREWWVRQDDKQKVQESQSVMNKMIIEILQPHYSHKIANESPRLQPKRETYL